jgi:hypothetical protein
MQQDQIKEMEMQESISVVLLGCKALVDLVALVTSGTLVIWEAVHRLSSCKETLQGHNPIPTSKQKIK